MKAVILAMHITVLHCCTLFGIEFGNQVWIASRLEPNYCSKGSDNCEIADHQESPSTNFKAFLIIECSQFPALLSSCAHLMAAREMREPEATGGAVGIDSGTPKVELGRPVSTNLPPVLSSRRRCPQRYFLFLNHHLG